MSKDNSSSNYSLINIDTAWVSKLIDVISSGVGALSANFVAKQITKGKKYEIEEIAKSIAEANKLPVKANYKNGNLTVQPKDDSIDPVDFPEYRAAEFMVRKESLKLASVEKASLFTAEELKKKSESGEKISDKDVDERWISKFFDEVGNIREEKALKYWSKLLAGEIQSPGSFSIRTLNLLGNINTEEAELIYYALNHTFLVSLPKIPNLKFRNNFGFIFYENQPETYENEVLPHYKAELLSSLGILASSSSTVMLLEKEEDEKMFYYGNYGFKVSRADSQKPQDIRSGKVKLLTHLGLELLELQEFETNKEYIFSVGSKISKKNLDVTILKDSFIKNEQIYFDKVVREIPHN